QAEIAHFSLIEPSLHHLQRRRLFTDEENRFTQGEKLRDDVGDRLGLSRAGWTIEDETHPSFRRFNGLVLAAVGVEDMVGLHGTRSDIQIPGIRQTFGDPYWHGTITGDRATEFMFGNLVLVLAEILPHCDLLKAEVSQSAFIKNLPILL